MAITSVRRSGEYKLPCPTDGCGTLLSLVCRPGLLGVRFGGIYNDVDNDEVSRFAFVTNEKCLILC